MAEPAEHPVHEHLNRIQTTLDGIERELGRFSAGMAVLNEDIAAAGRHDGQLAADRRAQQLAIDDFNNRLGRIEQRLGLSD